MQSPEMVASVKVNHIIATPPENKGRPMAYVTDPKMNRESETMEASDTEPRQGGNQTTAGKGKDGKCDGGTNGQKGGENHDKAGGWFGEVQKGSSGSWSEAQEADIAESLRGCIFVVGG